ncbi:methyltransferase-like protein 2 isoform X1 [Ananas comosus]|uniref:Methyltransferase-like protein 2 isoform X1 n=1 Tax=Ananas comosus TaxID=4615 RepID=A0A6P5GAI5_ANACO|nr:methyltransferase-like protein 2 isoform X1 [Ananas comosus]XP_020104833.1 methyltransferase-like protein 2 isoform X1 [Ananas comosus]XP_020104834.1 methyltransferase-like protein 2 isoform X1 [Ananas comosus]XP_020104835.1 methyltransferase-like protein 2 isoform X1 [Ananas comosus]XP_020104836.1 methyltransferase-like protein 2 isoform X1 [Ananas comosus]XP_020104837.1 methyltransferase-like protein 2 isoform X1 [Ananas comosus]XP_020104838.1 methyltransferase-like protein 2 isoform X1 
MAAELSEELKSFMETGIYRLDGSNVVFIDPVRVLNESYSRFALSPSDYYSRSFAPPKSAFPAEAVPKKRKRKPKPHHDLNERERVAEKRHQEARALLLSAHKALLAAADLLGLLPQVMGGEGSSHGGERAAEKNFVELGNHWKAPFCEITLGLRASNEVDQGSRPRHDVGRAVVSLFNNLIGNETNDDVEAEFQNCCYILPRRSSFHMSDLRQIRDLVPAQSSQGFNLIVIDPPWENGSVHQKAAYPTLPNRYFFNLPVKELAHEDGALVVLWMTNREKLRMFVEKELLPGWGVTDVTPFYWLKVKPDGSLICDLDLFHHRPYECFLIGYINVDVDFQCTEKFKYLKSSQVIISVPGAHSRKPPLEKLLLEHIPGPKPAKCIELFARELTAGWISWGNEPLRFQDSLYFLKKTNNWCS